MATALAVLVGGGPLGSLADQALAGPSAAYRSPDGRELGAIVAALDVPADPVAAARTLTGLIHRRDPNTAAAATIELLRRAGFPIVSSAGPVVALPDEGPLQDIPIYAEFVPDLTRAVRRGDGYTGEQLATILADIGLRGDDEEVPASTIVGGLGVWGKSTDDPAASRFAGAAVRALSGIRRQVLTPGSVRRGVWIDPLQTLLVIGHLTSRRGELAAAPIGRGPGAVSGLLGGAVARAATTDPCKSLDDALKTDGEIEDTVREAYVDRLKDAWEDFAPKTYRKLEVAGTAWEKGSAATAVLLLLMGITFDLNDDKGGLTHYKHKPGDRSRHITMRAVARFDSTLSQAHIACYNLVGIDIPKNGGLPGFRVRWRVDQPTIDRNMGNFFTGEGRHLTPIRADSRKIDACGTCGDITDGTGTSTLELAPRVERTENPVGEVEEGKVTVVAALDKDEFPFKLKDFLGLNEPGTFAFDKLWDIAMAALKRAGLPNQTRVVTVEYHQREIYVAKGETTLFAIYYMVPVFLDIYTCEGIRAKWQGTGGFRAEKFILGTLLQQFIGKKLPDKYNEQANLDFTPHETAETFRFDILPPMLNGVMEIDDPSDDLIQGVGSAGTVEIQLDDLSVDPIAIFDPLGARYPIRRVDVDERCPDSGDAYFENI